MYRDRISILKKGYAQEVYRSALYSRYPIADLRMREITSVDVAAFRDQRLAEINPRTKKPLSPATVRWI